MNKIEKTYRVKRSLPLIAIFILLFVNCETPIDLDLEEETERIVVEGVITDQPGPYEVILTRTAAYSDGSKGVNVFIDDAVVTIFDDTGYSEELILVDHGTYHTDSTGIQGEVGRTYWIEIITPEGDTYRSTPEKMPPLPEIENIYYEFKEESEIEEAGHLIKVDFTDPQDNKNYYRWNWEGLYRFRTNLGRMFCCAVCWKHERNANPFIINALSDEEFDGQSITHPVVKIPFFSRTIYLSKITQYAITREAYDFYNALQLQQKSTGSIFDTPPYLDKGNINNINNPEKYGLGYFSASGARTTLLEIDRSKVPYPATDTRPYPGYPEPTDCRTLPDSYVIKPPGWE